MVVFCFLRFRQFQRSFCIHSICGGFCVAMGFHARSCIFVCVGETCDVCFQPPFDRVLWLRSSRRHRSAMVMPWLCSFLTLIVVFHYSASPCDCDQNNNLAWAGHLLPIIEHEGSNIYFDRQLKATGLVEYSFPFIYGCPVDGKAYVITGPGFDSTMGETCSPGDCYLTFRH